MQVIFLPALSYTQITGHKPIHTPVGLFSGSRTLKLDGLKTGGLSFWSRMVTVRGTLLFKPPMSSPTRNSSTRGSWKASRSNIAPWRTCITPWGRYRDINCIEIFTFLSVYLLNSHNVTGNSIHSKEVHPGSQQAVLHHSIRSNVFILSQNWPI